MQQTQKYKLNKPGKDDMFSLEPLNENMDKVESALASEATARQADSSDLKQRVVKLENCRIVVGWYQGSDDKVIDLGERPAAVLVCYYGLGQSAGIGLVTGDHFCNGSGGAALKLVDNGFWVSNTLNRTNDGGYCFVAFLGGWPHKEFPKETA